MTLVMYHAEYNLIKLFCSFRLNPVFLDEEFIIWETIEAASSNGWEVIGEL